MDEIYNALDEIVEVDYGPGRVARVEHLVREADRLQNVQIQIDTRLELVESATFSGQPQKSLVAFTWLLPHYGERISEGDAWLHFRWITEDIVYLPDISREQVDETLQEMERFYQRFNWWASPVHEAYARWARVRRDRDELEKYVSRFLVETENAQASFDLHDRHFLAESYLSLGRVDAAIEVANLSRAARSSETEYPHRTHALLCRWFEQEDIAVHHFRTAVRLCDANPVFLRELGWLIAFAAERGFEDETSRLINIGHRWAEQSVDGYAQMNFFRCVEVAHSHGTEISFLEHARSTRRELARQFTNRHASNVLEKEIEAGALVS